MKTYVFVTGAIWAEKRGGAGGGSLDIVTSRTIRTNQTIYLTFLTEVPVIMLRNCMSTAAEFLLFALCNSDLATIVTNDKFLFMPGLPVRP